MGDNFQMCGNWLLVNNSSGDNVIIAIRAMLRSRSFRLLSILLVVSMGLTACRKWEGAGIIGPVFETESQQILQERSKEFATWVCSKGFSPRSGPGGMTEWSGGHTQGDEATWYGIKEGRREMLLRVTVNANERQIRTDIDYAGRFYPEESRQAKARTREIYKDILLWFMTRPQPDLGNENDAKQKHDSYRKSFDWVDSHPEL